MSARRTILVFAAIGGIGVPIVLTVAAWCLRALAADAGGALLHDVRLSLWPMSRLFDAAEASRHWLYLPLAAVLSNALVYAAIGALAAWGRAATPAFVAAVAAAVAVPLAVHATFDTSAAAAALVAGLAVIALALHRYARRDAT